MGEEIELREDHAGPQTHLPDGPDVVARRPLQIEEVQGRDDGSHGWTSWMQISYLDEVLYPCSSVAENDICFAFLCADLSLW
jgi:hypothetical protein